MSGWLGCPARACAWSTEITDVPPDNSLSTCLSSCEEVAGSLFTGTGWLAADPAHCVFHTLGCKDSFAQVKTVRSPVPQFTPSAISITLALLYSTARINRGFFPFVRLPSCWGKVKQLAPHHLPPSGCVPRYPWRPDLLPSAACAPAQNTAMAAL